MLYKRTLFGVGLVLIWLMSACAPATPLPEIPGLPGAERSSLGTPTAEPTETHSAAGVVTSTPTFTSSVAGNDCGLGCMWSSACVALGMTLPEQNGLTRVQPNSCVPVDSSYWNITPDDPFWGMPCSSDTVGVCVWSRQCVDLGLVPAVKNGLAPVYVGSCQLYVIP